MAKGMEMVDINDGCLGRGKATDKEKTQNERLSDDDLIELLKNKLPTLRTSAARILGERKCIASVPFLCSSLLTEKALYPRLAICEALAAIGEPVLPDLVTLIGMVGNNRHESLPERGFYKKSYPLPRDLAVRTIIRIGPVALPFLEDVLQTGGRETRLETIDGIGHIAFYSMSRRSEPVLQAAYQESKPDSVLLWKLIRAFQSFPSDWVRITLIEIILHGEIPAHRWEAVRSLGQIKMNIQKELIRQAGMDENEEVRNMAGKFLREI